MQEDHGRHPVIPEAAAIMRGVLTVPVIPRVVIAGFQVAESSSLARRNRVKPLTLTYGYSNRQEFRKLLLPLHPTGSRDPRFRLDTQRKVMISTIRFIAGRFATEIAC